MGLPPDPGRIPAVIAEAVVRPLRDDSGRNHDMRKNIRVFALAAAGLLLAPGCAKDRQADFSALTGAEKIAWSINNPREELTVAASPVRQTLQILGSAGTVLGFGISAAQDAAYAKAISDALGEYSPGTVFEQRLADALAAHLGEGARRVAPVGTAAGYNNPQEAKKARWEGLALRAPAEERTALE